MSEPSPASRLEQQLPLLIRALAEIRNEIRQSFMTVGGRLELLEKLGEAAPAPSDDGTEEALDLLRQELGGLAGRLAQVDEKLAALARQPAEPAPAAEEPGAALLEGLDGLAARLEQVDGRIAELAQQAEAPSDGDAQRAALLDGLGGLTCYLERVETRLAELSQSPATEAPPGEEQLAALLDGLEGLTARLEQVDARLDDLSQHAATEAQLSALARELEGGSRDPLLEELRKEFESLAHQLGTQERRISAGVQAPALARVVAGLSDELRQLAEEVRKRPPRVLAPRDPVDPPTPAGPARFDTRLHPATGSGGWELPVPPPPVDLPSHEVELTGHPPLELPEQLALLVGKSVLVDAYLTYRLLRSYCRIRRERRPDRGFRQLRVLGLHLPLHRGLLEQKGLIDRGHGELSATKAAAEQLLAGHTGNREDIRRVFWKIDRSADQLDMLLEDWLEDHELTERARTIRVPTRPLPPYRETLRAADRPVLAYDLGTGLCKVALRDGPEEVAAWTAGSSLLVDLRSGELLAGAPDPSGGWRPEDHQVLLRGLKSCLGCDGVDADGACRNPWGGCGGRHDPQSYCGATAHRWTLGNHEWDTAQLVATVVESHLSQLTLPDDFELHASVPVGCEPDYRRRYLEALSKLPQLSTAPEEPQLFTGPGGAALFSAAHRADALSGPFVLVDLGAGSTELAAFLPGHDTLHCLAQQRVGVGTDSLVRQLEAALRQQLEPQEGALADPEVQRQLARLLSPTAVTKMLGRLETQGRFSVEVEVPDSGAARLQLEHAEVADRLEPLTRQIVEGFRQVRDRANISLATQGCGSVASVLLIGGGATSPIAERLFPGATLRDLGPDNLPAGVLGASLAPAHLAEQLVDRLPHELCLRSPDGVTVPLLDVGATFGESRRLELPRAVADGGLPLQLVWRRSSAPELHLVAELWMKEVSFPLAVELELSRDSLRLAYNNAQGQAVEHVLDPGWSDPAIQIEHSAPCLERTRLEPYSVLSDHDLAGFPVEGLAVQRYIRDNVRAGDRLELVPQGTEQLVLHEGTYIGRLGPGASTQAARVAELWQVALRQGAVPGCRLRAAALPLIEADTA